MARGIIFHSTGTLPSGTPLLRGELPVAGFMVLAPPSRNLVIASKASVKECSVAISTRVSPVPISRFLAPPYL